MRIRATEASSDNPRKEAFAAAGGRWLAARAARAMSRNGAGSALSRGYNFVAGPKARGTGLASRAWNAAGRPLRAVLAPNLGTYGSVARAGFLGRSLGSGVAEADRGLSSARRLLDIQDMDPGTKDEIRSKLTFGGVAGSMLKRDRSASEEFAAQTGKGALRSAARSARDSVWGGRSASSWLNPIGSRVFTGTVDRLANPGKGVGR